MIAPENLPGRNPEIEITKVQMASIGMRWSILAGGSRCGSV